MSVTRVARWAATLACCVTLFVHAESAPYVPSELEPWRAWVLHGEGAHDCPFLFDQPPIDSRAHRCAWPGVLQLDVSASGARFTQSWQVYTAGWAPLPGAEGAWPTEVTEGGRVLPVTEQDAPSVWLEPGRHQLNGRFQWTRMPAALPIPERTGLVALTLDGRAVDRPQRTADTLWLGQRQEALAPEADALRVQVFRLLSDGIPLTLTTRVQLDVAGASREVLLARAAPAGFAPVQLTSDLPARIEPDGRLRVQLSAGSWHLELRARAETIPEQVTFDPGEGDWAEEEIWSYESDEALRVTVPEGSNAVDPAQVGVPDEWQGSPSFRLTRGDALRIVERSRGLPASLENRLTLQRMLWRDYAGTGYTIVDAVSGQMETGWRLDMHTPYRLGSAQADGKDLLITQGEGPELAGVEVRDKALSLRALSRFEGTGNHLPATGWQQRFESASLTLHLPAGQRLLAAPGADDAPDTWLHAWRLLDFFLVLFIALAVGRLLSPLYGGIALVMLILTYQEPGAPIWIWLALLLAVALVRFTPEGRLLRAARTLRLAAFLAFALVAVPFIAVQLRAALYPQLDAQLWWGGNARYFSGSVEMPMAAPPDARGGVADMATMENAKSEIGQPEEMTVTSNRIPAAQFRRERLDYAPSVLVQSGPAVPQWNGVVYQLGWSGPVSADDDLRLIILGTLAYRCVRVLSVLLIGVLVSALARLSFGKLRWPSALSPGMAASALLACLVAAPLFMSPHAARADTPDPALLKDLKDRLLESPKCAPRCAALARAHARVEGDVLTLDLDVQAQALVAFPLPGALHGWEPARVTVDGVSHDWLYREGDELLIVLDEGAHGVQLSGPMPPAATVRIPFPETPQYIEVDAHGWTVSGVADGQLASGALALERSAGKDAPQGASSPLVEGVVAPFVRVTRTLLLDVEWAIDTRVERLAPPDSAFTVEIPLLTGEAVTAGVPVRDGRVLASFEDEAEEFSWYSTLAPSQSLSLTAGDGKSYVEIWQVQVGPTWRVTHDGTPLIASEENTWVPEFHPRPGETLALEVSRPAALEGSTLTLESTTLRTTAGQRVVDSQLDLQYRSTRGGTHTLRLPPAARVVAVTSDGETLSARPDEGALTLPIRPGEHQLSITLQEERAGSVLARTAAVDLGHASGNVSITLAFGAERWVLFTRGPWEGPAVLLWGELIAFLLLAPVLARLPGMPLRTWQWLLLGIGFSTFAWGMLVVLALWFLAFAWRERGTLPAARWRYNLVQAVLVALTLGTFAALLSTILWGALLGQPDMHIVGNGSSASELHWFVDRVAGTLPQGSALSLPHWVYQGSILLWALWLSFTLLRWLPWAWRAWGREGIWRGRMAGSSAAEP